MRYIALAFCLAGVLSGCVTTHPDPRLELISESEYHDVIEKSTQSTKLYDGFMNVLDMSGTLLNSRVLSAQTDHNARVFQWNPEQYQAEKTKALVDVSKETVIFLSFFVPERKHDDLQRATTRWKIFLDVNNRRIEVGKVTREKGLLVEVQALYPHHTRWHSAYKLIFPVPVADVEKSGAKLTVTGPVGSASVDYPALP